MATSDARWVQQSGRCSCYPVQPNHAKAHQAGLSEHEQRGLNRTENVRPIAPDDPDFAALYARRNDAESINRHLDDTMWLGRAHSVGHTRQHLNLIGFALCVNSIALHQHRQRRHQTHAA